MNQTARTFLTLILSIFVLSGCSSTQAPTRYSDGTNRFGDMDFIPDEFDGSLQERNEGDDIGDDKYGDFTMVRDMLSSVYFGFDSSSVAASERIKLQEAPSIWNRIRRPPSS